MLTEVLKCTFDAHALLSLLVFNHGFIQIHFGIFEIFCFCFMISKYYLILWNFARYVYSVNAISFFIDEKRTQNLNTKVKVFHESISSQQTFVLMKTSWRRLSSSSSEGVLKTSSRRLDQDEFVRLSLTSSEDVLVKTNIFVLAIRVQDVFKTFSRRTIKLMCSW